VAIDPTAPVTPIVPAPAAGTMADSVATVQAMARQALANATAQLGEIAGRPAAAQTGASGLVEAAGQAGAQDAGPSTESSQARGAPPASQASTTVRSETPMLRAVRAAAAEAVPRQTGLAPLMANVRDAVERPDTPDDVRAAGRALLAKTPSAAEIATPQGLRQAVERSGIFLEAKMARAAAAPTPDLVSRPPEVGDMKAALLVFRSALSAWLSKAPPPQIAEAPEADPRSTSATGDATPEEIAPSRAASSVLAPTAGGAQRLPPSGTMPSVIAAAPDTPSSSRPVAEVVNAAPSGGLPPAARPADPLSGDETLAARFGAFVATPKRPATAQAPVRPAMSALVQMGLINEETRAEDPAIGAPAEPRTPASGGYGSVAASPPRSRAPPPPYAGGPMAGQRPMASELPAEQPPVDVVRRLLKGTSGALARQDLLQIASLAETHEPEPGEVRPQSGGRLNLDLPFATPQGVAVAQFEFSHEGGGAAGGAVGPAERTYKARFSIDLEPLGPVHALVALTGARARVSLWAERAETIARLRAGEESLGAALRQAELSPEVAVHSGAPVSPSGASPLGHFVDQAS